MSDTTIKESPPVKATDWTKCCLCQENRNKPLRTPMNISYEPLANRLLLLEEHSALPTIINNIGRLDNGKGIHQTFEENQAIWHKECFTLCNQQKVDRAITNKRKLETDNEAILNRSVKRSSRKSSATSQNSESSKTCFFCDKAEGKLHDVQTMEVDEKVRSIATAAMDSEILVKLADGDMAAHDACYHSACLCNYYRKHKCSNESNAENEYECQTAVAFAELVNYIESYESADNSIPVFRLAELVKMYTQRLGELGLSVDHRIHSGHLKEKLLNAVPSLIECKHARDTLLTFEKHIGPSVFNASKSSRDDMVTLLRAASIVRKDIFSHSYKFKGSLVDCTYQNLPQKLHSLVNMVLSGSDISKNTETFLDVSSATRSITELLVFNSVKRHRKGQTHESTKHTMERETGLPLYVGLLVHTKTRKKDLVDILFERGLSVSYKRVLEVSEDIASAVLHHYHETGVVCPPYLKDALYTTGNLDNIDHNPSSLTSNEAFHGTAISVTQHVFKESEPLNGHLEIDQSRKKVNRLPDTYADIQPVHMRTTVPNPTNFECCTSWSYRQTDDAKELQSQWLLHVSDMSKNEHIQKNEFISWAAYFAARQSLSNRPPALTAVLPLFRESAHSVAMVKHGMHMIKDIVTLKNPGQIPVITLDQPLYALGKKIQWLWPEYGEANYFVMFGGLHIEMAFLKVIGDWLEGSGWLRALTSASIITPGKAENVQKGCNVGRGQWIHQIMAAALYMLKQQAYTLYVDNSEGFIGPPVSFSMWTHQESESNPQFKFWDQSLQLQLLLLRFLQAQREANFELYQETLREMLPWFFLLDHVHYARWLSVHLRDLENLPSVCPSTFQAFSEGAFVTQKSNRKFSTLAHDQVHEQQNALLKGDGGIIGITEMQNTLQRHCLSAPELTRILNEVGNKDSCKTKEHHAETLNTQQRFLQHVKWLTETLDDMGNPFCEESKCLIAIDTKIVAGEEGTEAVFTAEAKGQAQFLKFREVNLANESQSFYEPIKKSKMQPFKKGVSSKSSNASRKVTTLKNDINLFSRMYIACQNRDGDLDNFFEHENHSWPPSLAENNDEMKHSNKAELLESLERFYEQPDEPPHVTCKIIDGAATVQKLNPRKATVPIRTIEEYADEVLIPYVIKELDTVSRIDIVWDRYCEDSLKESARQHRGTSETIKITPSTMIPRSWNNFLRNDNNKRALYEYLSERISDHHYSAEKVVVSTQNEKVTVSPRAASEYITVSDLQPCSHEEADYRMMLHATHLFSSGHNDIMIHATDTDVVVLATAISTMLQDCCIWIAFGNAKHFRFIPAHTIAQHLGPVTSWGLLFLHAISGCDTVSSFGGVGKKTAFSVWMSMPELHPLFQRLSTSPDIVTDDDFSKLERFVVLLYSRTLDLDSVNAARKYLFSYSNRQIDRIPPTHSALVQHILRAVYQSGHIWGQMFLKHPGLPSPSKWGWKTIDNKWCPVWSTLAEASKDCQELIKCNCRVRCFKRCKCIQASLPCTQLCKCQAVCDRDMSVV